MDTNPSNETSKKRVLVVEDNQEEREFYADFLSKEYEIEQANDGGEALDKIISSPTPYDLILLDIMMPKMDGISFLKAKNQLPRISDIPVIVLTNLAQEDTLKTCLDLKVKSYILKAETTPDKVLNIVKGVI